MAEAKPRPSYHVRQGIKLFGCVMYTIFLDRSAESTVKTRLLQAQTWRQRARLLQIRGEAEVLLVGARIKIT